MHQTIVCLLVALIWGYTNQLLSLYTPKIPDSLPIYKRLIAYTTYPKFILSFLANQSGSLLFYYALSSATASQFIPSVNALTILTTFLFEPSPQPLKDHPQNGRSAKQYLGIALILVGTFLLS